MIPFGQKIKELREEKGISQRKLAKELHISQTAVASYESGRIKPSADMLIAIAQYFEITYDELFEYVK